MKIYSETYRSLMKYIKCHGGKGYYCCHVGALREYVHRCVSPNNYLSQTFFQGKSSQILRNSKASVCVVLILHPEFVLKVLFSRSKQKLYFLVFLVSYFSYKSQYKPNPRS